MKMKMRNLIVLLGLGLLCSFAGQHKVKEGYYLSTYGHSSTLYFIKGQKVEWYGEGDIKARGWGTFKMNESDSIIEIAFKEIWTSRPIYSDVDFKGGLLVRWDSDDKLFVPKYYEFNEQSEMIKDLKKRVKTNCNIKRERPSR
jgi:hypothetical protein